MSRMCKEPFTITIDRDLRKQIEDVRTRLERGGEKPSAASIVREALRRALPVMTARVDGTDATTLVVRP